MKIFCLGNNQYTSIVFRKRVFENVLFHDNTIIGYRRVEIHYKYISKPFKNHQKKKHTNIALLNKLRKMLLVKSTFFL